MSKPTTGAWQNIHPDSDLVRRHMEYMEKMVRIDSRSFNVNEYRGDRETPTDMKEILQLAEEYLKGIGFPHVRINQPPRELARATPILLAEIAVDKMKPTVLLYAHLDKQPYMDDEKFAKWNGVPPWELRWSADRSRAYGRGAADDLSGVIAIGMAVDAFLGSMNVDPRNPAQLAKLPCNIKVIYETEEEAGSVSLIDQIRQNHDFFASTNCVVITDVVNPAQGIPGLTISLRGMILIDATLTAEKGQSWVDSQTALYKMLATLVHEDHSLAVTAIAKADKPLSEQERHGYSLVPTSIDALRGMAGLLPATRLTVPADKVNLLEAQLRKSYTNVRPGHRVSGNVIFGSAGARLSFRLRKDTDFSLFKTRLEDALNRINPYHLKLRIKEIADPGRASFDVILQSANKDPHSGVTGGPFPIPEIQLARMIDRLIGLDGVLHPPALQELVAAPEGAPAISVRALWVDHDGVSNLFTDLSARAQVEIRLAPGNDAKQAQQILKKYLLEKVPPGFVLEFKEEKDGSDPWMTDIDHPVFSTMMEALNIGYSTPDSTISGSGPKACLYGCGGSIPFVKKLMTALGDIHPLCIGAYDPDSRVHEPNESLSMVDLLGCARSIVYFLTHSERALPKTRS